MRYLRFLIVGIMFGIILTKSEAVSWFRIYEMFRFQAFHMYGIIISAIGVGNISVALLKRLKLRALNHERIKIPQKKLSIYRYAFWRNAFRIGVGVNWCLPKTNICTSRKWLFYILRYTHECDCRYLVLWLTPRLFASLK